MKKSLLLTVIFALASAGAWADEDPVILNWGVQEPWQMKFVKDPAGGYDEPNPGDDGNGLTWTQLGYDDSSWGTLTGPMANGDSDGPVINPNYTWEGENHCFCLRRTFTLDNVNPDGYTFAFYCDDCMKVYVNGQRAFEIGGSWDLRSRKIDASLFRKGENQLAICYYAGPFSHNFLEYALFTGNCYTGWGDFGHGNKPFICLDGIRYQLCGEERPNTIDVVGVEEGLVTAHVREKITIDGNEYPVTGIVWFGLWNNTLKHAYLPKTLSYFEVYYDVFNSPMETIVVDPENPIFDSRDNCNAIIETKTNKAVCIQPCSTIPSSVKTLGFGSIKGNYSTLLIPEGVECIEGMAFGYCSGTTVGTLSIPASCTKINESPFGTGYFSNIIVHEDNPNYYMQNGCLIERSTKMIVTILPDFEEITIPEDVEKFGEQSFWNTRDTHFYYNRPYPWKNRDHRQIGLFGHTGTLHVPQGTIPRYLYQEWDRFSEGFKAITDGIHTYYCVAEGDTWFAPHIDCVNYPANKAGDNVTLSVLLNADQPIVGFQFDVYLPEGMEVTFDEDGYENILLSTARTTARRHVLTSQQMPDGAWRVICYSNSNFPFDGEEGEVCTIQVKTNADMANGGYPVIFKNITTTYLSGEGKKEQFVCDHPITSYVQFFTPSFPLMGDVNVDGKVNVTDITAVVSHIMGNHPTPFLFDNGNVYKDDVINVTDIAGIVDIIMGTTQQQAPRRKARRATEGETAEAGTTSLKVFSFFIVPGEEKEVEVVLHNPDEAFTGLQFDLALPEGISLVNDEDGYLISPGSRTNSRKHTIEARQQTDGTIRIMVYSNHNTNFSGTDGDVVILTLKADEQIKAGVYSAQLFDVILSQAEGDHINQQEPADESFNIYVNDNATSIDKTTMNKSQKGNDVYNLAGQRVSRIQHGVNIIGNKKVVLK